MIKALHIIPRKCNEIKHQDGSERRSKRKFAYLDSVWSEYWLEHQWHEEPSLHWWHQDWRADQRGLATWHPIRHVVRVQPPGVPVVEHQPSQPLEDGYLKIVPNLGRSEPSVQRDCLLQIRNAWELEGPILFHPVTQCCREVSFFLSQHTMNRTHLGNNKTAGLGKAASAAQRCMQKGDHDSRRLYSDSWSTWLLIERPLQQTTQLRCPLSLSRFQVLQWIVWQLINENCCKPSTVMILTLRPRKTPSSSRIHKSSGWLTMRRVAGISSSKENKCCLGTYQAGASHNG